MNLSAYDLKADVTANTNGLKTAAEQKDGTFKFSARKTGNDSGIKDETLGKSFKAENSGSESKWKLW